MRRSQKQKDSSEIRIANINARQAIIVAVITALASVAVTLITVWETIRTPTHADYLIVGRRAKWLVGTWQGTYDQLVAPSETPLQGPLQVTIEPLNPKSQIITGSGVMEFNWGTGNSEKLNFRIRGGFLYSSFLRLNYENVDKAAIQFASAVVELSKTGRELSGRYVGYGATSRAVVTGTVTLEKQL
jgi:hypothetical protein